jgi:hypothetical protein
MEMELDWSNAIQQLNQVQIYNYFKKRSMPEFVEPLVTKLIDSFVSNPALHRDQLLDYVSPQLSMLLGWYARKLAGRAVRDHSKGDLWRGLIALAISASKGDFRDVLAPLALLHNSVLLLDEDPKLLFEAASKTSTASVEQLFASFLDRSPAEKSIIAFGFSEGSGPAGFDYVPLLPEYGGPTPLG